MTGYNGVSQNPNKNSQEPQKQRIPQIELPGSAKLTLRPNCSLKILYLCQAINSVEWSGVLFIKQLAGDLSNPDSLEFEAIDMFPMDIGDHGSTSFKWTPDLIDAYDQNPELMDEGVRTALVHSHHNMNAYFSGVDKEELQDNTPEDVDMYLSLVVNNKMQWDCKIAMYGTHKVESFGSYKTLYGKGTHRFTAVKEEPVLYTISVKVYLNDLGTLAQRVSALEEQKADRLRKAAAEKQLQGGQQKQLSPFRGGDIDDNDYSTWAKNRGATQLDIPFNNKSRSTGHNIPAEYGQLLMLSSKFDGTLADALRHTDQNFAFSGGHSAQYMHFFRAKLNGVIADLKAVALNGKEDEPEWEYELLMDFVDEIQQWRAGQPLYDSIIKELQERLESMGEEEEEEDLIDTFTTRGGTNE